VTSDAQEHELHETDPASRFLIVDNTVSITGPDLADLFVRVSKLEQQNRSPGYLRDANLGLQRALDAAVKDRVAYGRALDAAIALIRDLTGPPWQRPVITSVERT
jgi:hypothetical protein